MSVCCLSLGSRRAGPGEQGRGETQTPERQSRLVRAQVGEALRMSPPSAAQTPHTWPGRSCAGEMGVTFWGHMCLEITVGARHCPCCVSCQHPHGQEQQAPLLTCGGTAGPSRSQA